MLGEIDQVLARIEALPPQVATLQARMLASAAILDAAGERYRTVVQAFTEQAKEQVSSYLERRAGEVSTQMLERHDQELRALLSRVLAETVTSSAVYEARPPRSLWPRIAEIVCAASLAALLTGGIVYWLVR